MRAFLHMVVATGGKVKRKRGQIGFVIVLLCSLVYLYSSVIEKNQHSFGQSEDERQMMRLTTTDISGNNANDVLIIGYLRGGTSFMGEILGFKYGSFYIYEPLYKLMKWEYMDHGLVCSMRDQTCSKKNNVTETTILDITRGIYSCDSRKYKHLLRSWQYDKSIARTQRNQSMCSKSKKNCHEEYLKQCSTALTKVSKVPRLNIGLSSKLLLEFPNLKIIHLLRDPRAILTSRHKLRWTPVPGGALSLCKKMETDYLESLKMKANFRDKIYIVYYEDLIQNFTEKLKEIYSFVGYRLDQRDLYRFGIINSVSKRDGADSTLSRNSTALARAWRHTIKPRVLKETNKACSDLYKLLGYPQLPSMDEVRNMTIPLRMGRQAISN